MKSVRFAPFALLSAFAPALAGGYSDWAAVVVAGDSYAENGKSSPVFDNGRIAVADQLVHLGFAPHHIRQFTDWPERFHAPGLKRSTIRQIAAGLHDATGRAKSGCLVYFTSHGSTDGIGIGDATLPPERLARIMDSECHARPAVVVISACYSGVFVPKLKAPDRVVFTAAAANRSSFGCGEADKYTYFDACAIETLPKAKDFVSFGRQTIACVAAREKQEKIDKPSNPQLAVGERAPAVIPPWK